MTTTTQSSLLSALELVAMTKAVTEKVEKQAKDALPVGQHPVNFTVHVEGTITKGADYFQQIVQAAQPWALLAVALNKLNGTTVESIVREADAIAQQRQDELKAQVETALATIKGKTNKPCSGKTTAKLSVTLV